MAVLADINSEDSIFCHCQRKVLHSKMKKSTQKVNNFQDFLNTEINPVKNIEIGFA